MKSTKPFLCFLVLLCASAFLRETLSAQERPNILLILVDDLKPALGAYGDTHAITPHIDALAARGMRFDRAYCNQAVCAPSRFTLMLGSHSTSTGLYGLGSQLRELVPDAVTMPQHFAKHGGYRTESLGKVFHIGHGNEGDPASFSVPHFKDKVIEYLDPDSTDGGQLTREEALFTNQRLGEIRSLPRGAAYESPVAKDEDYADGRVAAETIKRLQAAAKRDQPFFIAAGFVRPHLPFSAPKKYWDLYDPVALPMAEREELPEGAPSVAGKRGGEIAAYKPVPTSGPYSDELKRNLVHGYYASTSFVDVQIGKVMEELDRLDLAGNTIVVLWGDHGFHLGDLGIWTKHTNYEQANRIPILIAAPGITKPGSSTKQLVESVDLFPTLAELAGLPVPKGPQPIDGVSLVPVLKDPDARVRDHAFHAYPKRKMGRAIRTERYRLVEWKGLTASLDTAEYELYDYQTDPLETRNLAADKPDVVAQLQEKLKRYPAPVQQNAKPGKPAPTTSAPGPVESPFIANRPLRIVAEVTAPSPRGVVLAQGGIENGYALHFVDGIPAFDVRIAGKVTRLSWSKAVKGAVRLEASLDQEKMSLSVNREPAITKPSPGLFAGQPKDGLSLGLDSLTPAGDYQAPNKFNGKILSQRIDANNPIVRGGQPVVETEYLTDALTREAVDFIDRHDDKPFFLYLAYNAVHSPLQGADAYMEKFAHIDDLHRRIFAAMLANMDDSVGAVMEQLRKSGLEENTIVFFLSDNGGPTKELTSSNLPLRGSKGMMYEGAIRVPFMVQWKGKIPAGEVYEKPVSSFDIFATAAANSAGATAPKQVEGVDLIPYLTGENEGSPHETLFWRQGGRTALRHGDWKLVRMGGKFAPGKAKWELYDLSKDLSEENNLAAAEPERLAELLKIWEKHNSEMSDPLWAR